MLETDEAWLRCANLDDQYDIEQLIWVKNDHPDAKLVLVGAMEAPFVSFRFGVASA